MKCIHCGTDSNYRDRSAAGGRCPKCSHRFAFEPTKDALKVTDGQMQQAIQRVSAEGTVLFTERQLWYEFNRKWMRPGFWRSPYGWIPPLSGAGVGGVALAAKAAVLVVPAIGAGLLAGLGVGAWLSHRANQRAPRAAHPPRVSPDAFRRDYLAKWTEAHGPIPGLLPPREEAAAALPPLARELPGDVAAFSFDRAVVTDHWETAAMLVANRFHFEHNCAVLSRDGFPGPVAGTVREMLRRNPRLLVFALHDATVGGCLLPATLRDPEWFPDPGVRVVDAGLRPGTAQRLRLPALPGAAASALPPRLAETLPAEDQVWLLAGRSAEVASLRPAAVMRALYNAFVAVGLPGDERYDSVTDGGTIIWVGDLDGTRGTDTAGTDGFG